MLHCDMSMRESNANTMQARVKETLDQHRTQGERQAEQEPLAETVA